ncbi:MAG: Wzz/FepE/Etk N-terminal domain-containing protein, partial [Cytophagales bacterium]
MDNTHNDSFDEKNQDDSSFLNELDLIKFITIFRKKLYLIIAIFFLCLASARIYLHFTKTIYEAYSVIKLNERKDSGILGLNVGNQKENDSELIGEIEIIKSPSTLYKLIEKLNLQIEVNAQGDVNHTERFNNRPFEIKIKEIKEKYLGTRFYVKIVDSTKFQISLNQGFQEFKLFNFNEWTNYDGNLFMIEKKKFTSFENDYVYFFTYNSIEQAYKNIVNSLDVRIQSPDARTIYISFKDNLYDKALSIITHLDSIYFEVSLASKNKAQEQSLDFLNEQLEQTEAKLEDYEERLEYFAGRNKSYDVKIDFAKNLFNTDELDKKITSLYKELDDLNKIQDSFNKMDDKNLENSLIKAGLVSDPKIEGVIDNYFKLRKELEYVVNSEKPGTLTSQIKQNEMKLQLQRIVDYVDLKKSFLKENIAYFEMKSKELKREFNTLPSKETELTRLKRLYGIYEKFYLLILEKKAEFGITKAGTVPEFMVLYPPTVNKQPVFPNVRNIYLTAFSIAFVFGLVIVVFSYYSHNTIDNLGELERSTKASILGVIPKYTKSK